MKFAQSPEREIFLVDTAPSCVGIDIGTTSICAYAVRLSDGEPLGVFRMPNGADLPAAFPGDKRQDAEIIYERVRALTDAVLAQFPGVSAIGFTGQMHGILCTDHTGRALTPLYTWQDGRAGMGSPSACDEILAQTGYRTAAGYGLATAYALMQSGTFPIDTARICTVMDYTAARLCGIPVTAMHTSNAASLGLYHMGQHTFDGDALRVLGIDAALLPQVRDTLCTVGRYRGIPVTLPIGDNQASFWGSVSDSRTMALANFGTGSQISLAADGGAEYISVGSVEFRPLMGTTGLYCGAALCGGRAYAMLERFVREILSAAGQETSDVYPLLNRFAAAGLDDIRRTGQKLSVQTTFCGTRDDPMASGSVTGIREALFTPQALAAGTLFGMAEELYRMYQVMPHEHITHLAASGNAIRRNPVLRQILEQVFGMDVRIPAVREEAAFGAAMTAAVAAGYADSMQTLGRWVRYRN